MAGGERPIVVPEPMTRFKCNERGCCCRGWRIVFRPDDMVRLAEAFPEDEREPRLGRGVRVSVEEGEGEGKVVKSIELDRVGEDAACRFLEPDDKCEVHRRFGMAALPGLCVNFPAVPHGTPDRVEMHFELICPEVLAQIAESHAPYTIVALGSDGPLGLQARTRATVSQPGVIIGGVQVPWDCLDRIRGAILAALGDERASVFQRLADVSTALGLVRTMEHLERFSVPHVADRSAFDAFLATSVHAHSPRVLAEAFHEYRRFIWDLDGYPEDLEEHLGDWQDPYRRFVEPGLPEWLLRRYLAHRYFTVFASNESTLYFSYGSIVHAFAQTLRLMGALCGALARPIDVPIAKAAIGASEHFHRKLTRVMPPEALPWFTPDMDEGSS